MSVKATGLGTLGRPTPPEEILQREGPRGKTLDYVDARFVMDRLDEIGPENWQDAYVDRPDGSVRGGIGVNVDGEWIWKWDVGTASDIEPEKGAYSEALKRAGVKWGIARDLYTHKGKLTRAEKPVTGDAAKRPSELRREREAAAVPVSEAQPEQAVADGPWSEGALTVEGAIYLNATAGLDGEVRHSPDGPRLGFGLALDWTRKIPQVVALGDLAIDIHDAIGNDGKRLHGTKATVSGELLRVPWTKNGKAMPPFQRLMLARIETPDWTLPAPGPVIPEGQESLALGVAE